MIRRAAVFIPDHFSSCAMISCLPVLKAGAGASMMHVEKVKTALSEAALLLPCAFAFRLVSRNADGPGSPA